MRLKYASIAHRLRMGLLYKYKDISTRGETDMEKAVQVQERKQR